MASVTITDIDERLRHLPPEKLAVVYDFVSYLLERDLADLLTDADTDSLATMLASEAVLSRDWDRPDEDAAWACLLYTSPSPRDRQKSRMPSSA